MHLHNCVFGMCVPLHLCASVSIGGQTYVLGDCVQYEGKLCVWRDWLHGMWLGASVGECIEVVGVGAVGGICGVGL